MNKKIIISAIAMSMSMSIATANQYNIIISKDDSRYEITELQIVDTKTVYSEWIFVSDTNCNYSLNQGDFYYDQDFSQTKTCDQTESRVKTVTDTYSNGTTKDTNTNEVQTLKDLVTTYTEIGTHTEDSCKNILLFDSNLTDGNYYISHNGGINIDCDMTTDGGGWTKITTADKIQDGGYADFIFSDQGFSYSEALFVDNGNIGDFAVPITNNYYDWTGYHLAWNAVRLDGTWFNSSTGSKIPGDISNKLPLSDFTVLENASQTCYEEPGVVDTYCANKVIINTNGKEISGISDTQSLSSAALANNYFKMKFFIFVR